MKSILNCQQFKLLFFVHSLLAIVLAAPNVAAAGAANINLKDTNYPIPRGAYFVSPNGKESNSGKSANSPWPVEKAITKASSGSTIVFRGGTYRNVSINIRRKMILQAYPHEKPWLKGSIVVTGWKADGRTWRKDNWAYSFPPNVGSEYIDPRYPLSGYRDMVYINGVSLKQVASKAEVKPGTFYVDSAHKRLYIGNNPARKTVEATALEEAFPIWKTAFADPSNTVVRGLGFAHYAERGLTVAAPKVKLENNTFVWNGTHGVKFQPMSNGKWSISADAIVRGNTFSYNGRLGLLGDQADRLLLENNTISHNNVEHFDERWDAAGIKFVRTDGLIWRNNLVENNLAGGMWVDISSTNSTIVNNKIRNNRRYGIFLEISHKAIIASNVIYNNMSGIHISNSSSARVYNNTLAKNDHNLHIDDSTRNNTNAKEIRAGITWISRDHIVKNNILSNPSNRTTNDSLLFDASSCGTRQTSAQMIRAADYNAYYRKSSSKPWKAIRWAVKPGKCLPYSSVATFKSATGFESNALAIDDVATNPFFVDEENGDYRLKPNSPAIGRGAALPKDIARAIGLKPGVAVDLGALQSKVVLSSN